MADIQPLVDKEGEVVLDEDGEPEKDTVPATCALFFGSLDAYHPEITLRDATNILVAHAEKVSQALADAVRLSHPQTDDAEGRQSKNPPQSRAGKTSGGSGVKSASTRKRSGGQRRKSTK